MKVFTSLLFVALLATVYADRLFCDLTTGFGCHSHGEYHLSYTGSTHNGHCAKTYKMKINVGRHNLGYNCTFWTRNPQSGRYIYSIAEDPHATWYSRHTPYAYGFGNKARVAQKHSHSHEQASWEDAHETDRSDGYGFASYHITNGFLRMKSSNKDYYRGWDSKWYSPSSTTSYVGLNRRYSDVDFWSRRGSGLCYVTCDSIRRSLWRPGQPIHSRSADLAGARGPDGSPGAPGRADEEDEPVAEAEDDVDDEEPVLNIGDSVRPTDQPSTNSPRPGGGRDLEPEP